MDDTLLCKQCCVNEGVELKTNLFTSLNQSEKVNVACRIKGVTKPKLASPMKHFLTSMCTVSMEIVSEGKGSFVILSTTNQTVATETRSDISQNQQ